MLKVPPTTGLPVTSADVGAEILSVVVGVGVGVGAGTLEETKTELS